MTAPSFDQPDPFAAAVPPTPIDRASTRTRPRWLPVAGAAVLAIVAFGGGYAVANATASKATTANGTDNGNGQLLGPGPSGRPRGGNGGFGGGAAGTVGSVSADQMTITTPAGGSRIVLLTPTTTVTEVTSATKSISDITAGKTVTVIGTSNPDGSVTATRIVIGDVSLFGGRGGFGGQGSSPAPSGTP